MNNSVKCCALCCKNDALFVCSVCHDERYCCKEHQRQHWSVHKTVCRRRGRPKLKTKYNIVNCPEITGTIKPLGLTDDEKICLEERVRRLRVNEFCSGSVSSNICDEQNGTSNTSIINMRGNNRSSHSNSSNISSLQEDGVVPRIPNSSEPDLSTPIDREHKNTTHTTHPRSPSPSLFRLDANPDASLAEIGFSDDWVDKVADPIIEDLNKYGVCVIDSLLGTERANNVLEDVKKLHSKGIFHDGQVVSRNVQNDVRGKIRGDKITWVTGNETGCDNISQLVNVVDGLIKRSSTREDAGRLADYQIKLRTRAMVACYPGVGTHYVKHVDNPNGDGRCITAIYYLNSNWCEDNGGVLRIFPEGPEDQMIQIDPVFDRMLFFWSDRRNPHEVMPAYETRYAITVWYLDQKEREIYQDRMSAHTITSST